MQGWNKAIHSKVLKQLIDLKNAMHQNSRINTSNSILWVKTTLLPIPWSTKFIKPTFPSDVYH